MGLKVIPPPSRGCYMRRKGLRFSIARSGYVFFTDDLVNDFGLINGSGQKLALFVNEDTTPHTLAFMVCSSGNPMGCTFHPRTHNMQPYVYNKSVPRLGAQVGRWNITEKKDDIYLTDCPVGKQVERTEALDIIDEVPAVPVARPKRKYTRRADKKVS